MVRRGVPPVLRCAVWLSNVVQAVHPHQEPSYWYEYRTLAKARALDYAYETLLSRIVAEQSENCTPSDDRTQRPNVWEALDAPTYGQDPRNPVYINHTTVNGTLAARKVLIALEQILGLEYAPLLPTVVHLCLTNMAESYAFCTVREMAQSASRYMPTTRREHLAFGKAFRDIVHKLHEKTAEYLEDRGLLDPENLTCIFQNMFIGILPMHLVLRLFDMYTLEGHKVLFRFGVALMVLYKMEAAEKLITISNHVEFWDHLKIWAHDPRFNFDFVVRKAYGVHGRLVRKQLRFPSRQVLRRIIKLEEQRLIEDGGMDDENPQSAARPVGLVQRNVILEGGEVVKPVLAQSTQARTYLATWLPLAMRLTNLDLLYSTNYHGRSLERFYSHVKTSKHTFVLCEVLDGSVASNGTPTIVGMYASQAWRASPRVYGDGECFLFRLSPDAECWTWHPIPMTADAGDTFSENNETALLEQFMVGTRTYISMGGNPDGSCGLRLNEDLTVGESSPAVGFENEPLHGTGRNSVFQIGLVEAYGFTRQIDGRPI
uniref:Oxidation resistance protein 1 n=1 Tax=Phaeodactylum tricornutum TaxID=2850 RepID=A0A8J9SS00_PHATR